MCGCVEYPHLHVYHRAGVVSIHVYMYTIHTRVVQLFNTCVPHVVDMGLCDLKLDVIIAGRYPSPYGRACAVVIGNTAA